jgi:predicted nuclease of predicted toxin-antitoxin system
MQLDWELWLDVQISPVIAKWLSEETGLSVKSAYITGLNDLSDREIYLKAKNAGKVILISKDADFPDLIGLLGAPPKLISIRIGNCDNKKLFEFLKANIKQAINYLINFDKDIIELE